jgi:hypothetical protein
VARIKLNDITVTETLGRETMAGIAGGLIIPKPVVQGFRHPGVIAMDWSGPGRPISMDWSGPGDRPISMDWSGPGDRPISMDWSGPGDRPV